MGHRRARSDAGETLVETLVALAILSLAALAILAGLQLSVKASDIHRKQTTSGSYVRNYAEAIEKYVDTTGNYVKCASATDYAPATVGFTVPTGYEWEHSAAEPLAGNGSVITTGTCPTRDQGVQRLRLTLRSTDDRAAEHLTIVLRRACTRSAPCTD